ncbi:UDP-4-amino-4,6-dideoxy-N-acetyl-beta-L-altrosamine transaminase [Pseudomonas sp. HK3]
MIAYGRQSIDDSDIESVKKVLESDYLTQGPLVNIFENKICDYVGADYAVAVNSATSALHLACLALDIGHHDHVWTSAISFVASANCARYCDANVDFVDIDIKTGNICLEKLKEKLISSKINSTLPRAVVVVHMAGNPIDMVSIYQLSKQYNFNIIEDASHALGATYLNGSKVGCMKYSDFTIFSFHPVKMITTAEGGIVICKTQLSAQRVKALSSHGIIKKDDNLPWYYEQTELGYNYRLSDLHAALGISQIDRLDQFVNRRKQISNQYTETINASDISLIEYNQYGQCCHHLYQILSSNQLGLYQQLKASGYLCQVHYIPIPSQPYYKKLGQVMSDYSNADNFYQHVLSLPVYPTLAEHDVRKIIGVINDESGR